MCFGKKLDGKLGHVNNWDEVDTSDKASYVQWFSGFAVDVQQYKESDLTREQGRGMPYSGPLLRAR